ncbi:MAG: hypothetical protein U0230_09590 [Polyangiales bacterium]
MVLAFSLAIALWSFLLVLPIGLSWASRKGSKLAARAAELAALPFFGLLLVLSFAASDAGAVFVLGSGLFGESGVCLLVSVLGVSGLVLGSRIVKQSKRERAEEREPTAG